MIPSSSSAVPGQLLKRLEDEPEQLSELLQDTEDRHNSSMKRAALIGAPPIVIAYYLTGVLAPVGGLWGAAAAVGLTTALVLGIRHLLSSERRARELAVLEAGFAREDAQHLIALRRIKKRPDIDLSDAEAVREYLASQGSDPSVE